MHVSFRVDHYHEAAFPTTTFPSFDIQDYRYRQGKGRKMNNPRTNELMNDKEWDKWEEEDYTTKVKTVTWKEFVDDAIERNPPQTDSDDDFSE